MNTISFSKADLLTRAKDFSNKFEADQSFPYKDAVRDESDFFVGQLENAKGGTLAEIRDNAVAACAKDTKTANLAALGGMGLLVASFLVPLPAGASLLRLGGIGAGFYISNVVAGKAARRAATERKFAGQLTEWETALSAAAPKPAPAQPTPAPTQPAATQA